MASLLQSPAHRTARAAGLVGVLAFCPLVSAVAQQNTEAAASGATDVEVRAWHENLKSYAPLESGCFNASYPSLQWEKTACGPRPAFVSAHRGKALAAVAAAARGRRIPLETAGNGNDYVAQTAGITQSGLGTFPVAKGITSEKGVGVAAYGGGGVLGKNEFTLQLNTDINPSGAACSAFGYANCYVWEQFVYSTAGSGYPSEVFIQNWVFPSQTDYNNVGCPSGWEDASSSGNPACVLNSQAVRTPSVAATSLGSLKLSGTVSSGTNTAIFTSGTKAYAASEPDSTVQLGSWWNQSEFNVVGNGDGSEAVFNKGVNLSVNLVVKDGTANAPTCVSQSGTTGETNNLNLGACKAASGASPSITFTESD